MPDGPVHQERQITGVHVMTDSTAFTPLMLVDMNIVQIPLSLSEASRASCRALRHDRRIMAAEAQRVRFDLEGYEEIGRESLLEKPLLPACMGVVAGRALLFVDGKVLEVGSSKLPLDVLEPRPSGFDPTVVAIQAQRVDRTMEQLLMLRPVWIVALETTLPLSSG